MCPVFTCLLNFSWCSFTESFAFTQSLLNHNSSDIIKLVCVFSRTATVAPPSGSRTVAELDGSVFCATLTIRSFLQTCSGLLPELKHKWPHPNVHENRRNQHNRCQDCLFYLQTCDVCMSHEEDPACGSASQPQDGGRRLEALVEPAPLAAG